MIAASESVADVTPSTNETAPEGKRQHRHDTEWSIMRLSAILHREPSVPLLESARMKGRPKSWPGEKLERLLTAAEIEAVLQHRI